MKSRLFVVLLLVAVLASSARASAASLSGKYSYLSTKICQINLSWSVNPATGDTNSLSIPGNGSMKSILGTLNFDAVTGQVTELGTQAKGSLVLGNPPPGDLGDVTASSVSGSGAFSVTSSTLTLGGKTYTAVYGGIVSGVASRVRGMNSNSTCIETIILDHK